MGSTGRTFAEVDGFITMLLAACEDSSMNQTLELLLSQPDEKRRAIVFHLIERLRRNKAPTELIDALACPMDDTAAEKAYQVIYRCAKELKSGKGG